MTRVLALAAFLTLPIAASAPTSAVKSVVVKPDTLALERGDVGRATCEPKNKHGAGLTNTCTWKSTDTSVVRVTTTLSQTMSLTARKPGTAGIIAWVPSVSSYRDTMRVTVTDTVTAPPAPTVTGVILTPATASLDTGASRQFAATTQWTDSVRPFQGAYSATGGTVTTTGLYKAGSAAGAFRVMATQAGKADTSAITVTVPGTPSTAYACSGVTVAVGASLQAAATANANGTTFCLAAGKHMNQSVIPKPGQRFIGARDTLGNRLTTLDGGGSTVYAFNKSGTNPADITIKGLVIEKYNPPVQSAVIFGGWTANDLTSRWTVDSNEIRENATGGIRVGHRMKVRWNKVHHNHMEGIVGSGDSILVADNEIAFNNYLKEHGWGFEGGGTKFVLTKDLIVRNNYSHDNWGPGLWADIDNIRTLYENNRVEDNAGPGIFHEISHAAVIRNNTVKRNGFDFGGWIWGGGIQIATSQDVEIYGNLIEDNKVGISITEQTRGTGIYGEWVTKNINVHDNTVIQPRVSPPLQGELAAAAHDSPVNSATWYSTLHFTNNHYSIKTGSPTYFCWMDQQGRTWAQWKAYGNDVTGTFTLIP